MAPEEEHREERFAASTRSPLPTRMAQGTAPSASIH